MGYPSDLKDEEWDLIRDEVVFKNGYGNKRRHDHRVVLNAIFYVTATGCQWRHLPQEFPPWKTVYSYWRYLCGMGIWERILQKLVALDREKLGRKGPPTYSLIDSQSVKTTGAAKERGIDGGKKVKGRKRHIVTDMQGHLLHVKVHAANVHDTVAGCGVFEADRADDFNALALKIGKATQKYLTPHTIFLSSSFGAYLAYRVSQLLFVLARYAPLKVVLTSIEDPDSLLRRLSSPDFNTAQIVEISPESSTELQKEIYQFMAIDIQCLRSLKPNHDIKIPSPLWIFNGNKDPVCDTPTSEIYWKKRTLSSAHYRTYDGGHLPSPENWKNILRELFALEY